jgi:hypothetical protein
MTAAGYEDIRRLDVAMNNLFGMGSIQSISNFNAQVQQSPITEPLSDMVFERGAIQKLHSDKRLVFVCSDLIDGADIGVVQGRCGTGLPAETLQRLRIMRQFLGKELQRNGAVKIGVHCLVNHAHTTPANLFKDAVARNGCRDH